MALCELWAGRSYGTNLGNLFVKIEGEDDNLNGTLHFNEPNVGIVVYKIVGKFDGAELELSGTPATVIEGVTIGDLTAKARLNSRGDLAGEWSTASGSAGTFALFPHNSPRAKELSERTPDQLHTARHHFGAIGVDRSEIIQLADLLQSEFTKGSVVVSVTTGTEQSRFLEDFKKQEVSSDRAEIVKLHVQEPEPDGTTRMATIEFGPSINFALTQSADEAWALGQLERLKREVKRFERTYTTNFMKWGVGINQVLLAGALVALPDLRIFDRVILLVSVLILISCVNWLHGKLLPFAAIFLGEKPESSLRRAMPTIGSWIIAILAGALQTLLTVYLQGWLNLPTK